MTGGSLLLAACRAGPRRRRRRRWPDRVFEVPAAGRGDRGRARLVRAVRLGCRGARGGGAADPRSTATIRSTCCWRAAADRGLSRHARTRRRRALIACASHPDPSLSRRRHGHGRRLQVSIARHHAGGRRLPRAVDGARSSTRGPTPSGNSPMCRCSCGTRSCPVPQGRQFRYSVIFTQRRRRHRRPIG